MGEIIFQNPLHFSLAQQLLARATTSLQVQYSPTNNSVSLRDARVVRLLERLNDSPGMILPFFNSKQDFWLITGTHPFALEQVYTRLIRFLTPSYGYFAPAQSGRKAFEPEKSELQSIAATLFDQGYYRWQSRVEDRNIILDRLMLWLDLEAAKPHLEAVVDFSYSQLLTAFTTALAEQIWSQAQWALTELRQRHLTSAENLLYLDLQRLAAQGLWNEIWHNPEFVHWAKLPMPRPVRTIMLLACYKMELEQFEQREKWKNGLAAFASQRSKLGPLLSGPFELDRPEVIRTLIYQAAMDDDRTRLELLDGMELDDTSRRSLVALAHSVPAPTRPKSAQEQVMVALEQHDYLSAEHWIARIAEPDERTTLYLELAFHTQDPESCRRAWQAYQSLPFADQEALRNHPRFVAEYLTYMQDRLLPVEPLSDPALSVTQIQPELTADAQALKVWQIIGKLERRMRQIIRQRYELQFAENWEKQLHPDSLVIQRWESMREKDRRLFRQEDIPHPSLLEFTYLGELNEAIQRQWKLFENFLGADRTSRIELDRQITAISRVRNPLAHNRDVPEAELQRAEAYCASLLTRFDDAA